MKKKLYQEIEIPEGVNVEIGDNFIIVKGKEGEIKKNFNFGKLNVKIKENKILIGHEKATKREKKIINTFFNHIKNMIQGVQEKFEYQLKICFSHFPMTIEKKENEAIIKNFLGEKVPRKVKLISGSEVEITKDSVVVKAMDKEIAGQTAANFEKATRVPLKDRRVFQDGIFITNKCGREI